MLACVSKANHALVCGHPYHNICINVYRETKGVSYEEMKCPVCKLNHHDVTNLESRAFGDTLRDSVASASSGQPREEGVSESASASSHELSDAHVSDGEEASPPPAKAKPKAKAKAPAKAPGKAKAVAKPPPKATSKAKAKALPVAKPPPPEAPPAKAKAESPAEIAPPPPAKASGESPAEVAPPSPAKASGDSSAAAPPPPPPPPKCSLFDGKVLCHQCGRFESWSKCRLMSKQKDQWRCNGCNCKSTQYRGLGSWPSPGFSQLDEAAQQEFMRSLDGLAGGQVVAKAKETFEGFESHQVFYEDGGEYLPLSVWKNRGFDVAAIEEKSQASDRRPDLIFGTTYRVRIPADR